MPSRGYNRGTKFGGNKKWTQAQITDVFSKRNSRAYHSRNLPEHRGSISQRTVIFAVRFFIRGRGEKCRILTRRKCL